MPDAGARKRDGRAGDRGERSEEDEAERRTPPRGAARPRRGSGKAGEERAAACFEAPEALKRRAKPRRHCAAGGAAATRETGRAPGRRARSVLCDDVRRTTKGASSEYRVGVSIVLYGSLRSVHRHAANQGSRRTRAHREWREGAKPTRPVRRHCRPSHKLALAQFQQPEHQVIYRLTDRSSIADLTTKTGHSD